MRRDTVLDDYRSTHSVVTQIRQFLARSSLKYTSCNKTSDPSTASIGHFGEPCMGKTKRLMELQPT